MANDKEEAARIAKELEGQKPPEIELVSGSQAEDGSARGKSHDVRLKEMEEKEAAANKPAELAPPEVVPDAEDILQSAGYKVGVPQGKSADDGWSRTPTVKTQYRDPRFASTVSTGPDIYEQYNMSDDGQKNKLNELKKLAAKEGAPQVDIMMEQPEFSPTLGSFVVFVIYKEVFYRSLIEIK